MSQQELNTKFVSYDIISKQDFLKQIDESISQKEKSIWQKRIEQNSKKIYSLLYVLGIVLVCFMIKLPERNIENNTDFLLLIGDYLSVIIPALIIPVLFCFLVFIYFTGYYMIKGKINLEPIVYSALGIKKIEKDEKTIRKLGGIGLFPGSRYRINNSFEIQNEKCHVIVQRIETFNKNKAVSFEGSIIIFPINFSYHTTMLVLDKNINTRPLWRQKLNNKNWQKIILDDKKFMEEYQLFGIDQSKARIILTSHMTKKLQKLRDIYQLPVNILFIDDKIILAIENYREMFEFFDLEKEVMKEKCKDFYDDIMALFELQDILELK